MAHRRISSTEKGKGLALDSHQPQRTARVKVPLPDNSELLRKHSLTLIGRVTNKSVHKVWSLIPFFIEHSKTEFKPVGVDLGNGLFQFQFERETDLVAVLDQRPYHYARWMIILQRREPTLSPSFPSLIPFWIKVQGLPVHLWTEDIIKIIGQDIGQYEKAEITTLTARMKVHIDGLLPLIKSSVVEFTNGDEVTTTLVYERLDKHCTKCMRLDHELKECLVARAETRALKAAQEESLVKKNAQPGQEADSRREVSIASAHNVHASRERDQLSNVPFQFSASNQGANNGKRPYKETREPPQHRPYKEQSKGWQEKSSQRRFHQARERSRGEFERPSSYYREVPNKGLPPPPPIRSYYREVPRESQMAKNSFSNASRTHHRGSERGNPQEDHRESAPQEAFQEAIGEIREVMMQYTKCADPTEREVRQERWRQAEERGQTANNASSVARNSLALQKETQSTTTPERPPASKRLGPNPLLLSDHSPDSRERIPAPLRLGPPLSLELLTEESDHQVDKTSDRIPASLRLGPSTTTDVEAAAPVTGEKWKPGRPPGTTKIAGKPAMSTGLTGKIGPAKRKATQNKPSPIRRKGVTSKAGPSNPVKASKTKKGDNLRTDLDHDQATTASENAPLINLIPQSTRRRMDFRIPSSPAP